MNKRQKKKQIRMRNKKLIKEYPFLLPRNVWTGKIPKDYNYDYTEYDCIDKGWQLAFGKFLLNDLKAALVKTNYLNEFMFLQIKEKYGGLRLYSNGAPDEVHNVLRKYEYISECVCIKCGSPHATVINDYGWYLPVCKNCFEKTNKRRKTKGYGIISYNKAAGEDETFNEEYNIPRSYTIEKYTKGTTTEIVYDINDTVDKIEKRYSKRTKRKVNLC